MRKFFFFFFKFLFHLSFFCYSFFFFSFDLNFLESGVNSSSRQTSGVTKGYPKLAFWLNPHSFFAKDTTTFLNKEKMYLSKRKKRKEKKADKEKWQVTMNATNEIIFTCFIISSLISLIFAMTFIYFFFLDFSFSFSHFVFNFIEAARARTSPMHPSSKAFD